MTAALNSSTLMLGAAEERHGAGGGVAEAVRQQAGRIRGTCRRTRLGIPRANKNFRRLFLSKGKVLLELRCVNPREPVMMNGDISVDSLARARHISRHYASLLG